MESATNTLNLIELVKNCPQIYDASRSDFKVPIQKDQAWSTIAAKLQTTDEECRKRWRTLRERYTRELRRFKTHKADPNSTGTEAFGAAAWNLYNEMSFLQDHVKLRKTRSSFERTTLQIQNKDEAEENMMDNSDEVYAKFKISKIEDANNDQIERSIVIEHYREDPLSQHSRQEEHMEQIDDDGGIQIIDDNTIDDGVSYITSEEQPVNNRIMLTVRPSNNNVISAGASHGPNKMIKRKYIATDNESIHSISNVECEAQNKSMTNSYQQQTTVEQHHQTQPQQFSVQPQSEEDFFCRAVACTLKGLSRVHSMKAKVEIYQVLSKYTELEEN